MYPRHESAMGWIGVSRAGRDDSTLLKISLVLSCPCDFRCKPCESYIPRIASGSLQYCLMLCRTGNMQAQIRIGMRHRASRTAFDLECPIAIRTTVTRAIMELLNTNPINSSGF